MSLINRDTYQRGRLFNVADTELILVITHLNPNTRFNSSMDELDAKKKIPNMMWRRMRQVIQGLAISQLGNFMQKWKEFNG